MWKTLLSAFLGAIFDFVANRFKKSPEQIAKERAYEILNKNIDDLNSDRKPYELPVGTADQWGETVTTETRLESSQAGDIKRSKD